MKEQNLIWKVVKFPNQLYYIVKECKPERIVYENGKDNILGLVDKLDAKVICRRLNLVDEFISATEWEPYLWNHFVWTVSRKVKFNRRLGISDLTMFQYLEDDEGYTVTFKGETEAQAVANKLNREQSDEQS